MPNPGTLQPFKALYKEAIGRGAVNQEASRRYLLDPFAHLDEGHVKILDLTTLDEVEFRPYDHQRELLAAWVDLAYLRRTGTARWRNVHEEKSRQMGCSWILAWADLWALMYHPVPGLALHINAAEVDDGGQGSTTDSYFGRIRYMHERLPMQHRQPLLFKYMLIRNEDKPTSFLTGECASADPGRGGRYARALIDEAARISWDEAAQAALSRACPTGRLYNSTPNGEGNVFFRLRKTKPSGYRFLTHHWSRHPVYSQGLHVSAVPNLDEEGEPQKQPRQPRPEMKEIAADCRLCEGTRAGLRWRADRPTAHRYPGKLTSPWYEMAVEDLTDEQVAAELDIDYTGSLQARVYPEFDESVHVSPHRLPYEPDAGVELAWDYGLDTTAVLFLQDLPMEVRVIGEVEDYHNATPDTVYPLVMAKLREIGIEERLLTKDWTMRMLMIGDPAGDIRDQSTGRSLVNEYARHGFRIQSRRYPIKRTIIAVKRLLNGHPKPLVISGPDCPEFVRHIKNNRWPTDRQGHRKPGDNEPLNDEHNHALRAFAYFVSYKFPPVDTDESLASATRKTGGVGPEVIESIEAYRYGLHQRPGGGLRPGQPL